MAFCSEPLEGDVDVFTNGIVTQWIFRESSVREELSFGSEPRLPVSRRGRATRELRALADVGNGITLFEVAILDGNAAAQVTGAVKRVGGSITVVELEGGLESNYVRLRALLDAP